MQIATLVDQGRAGIAFAISQRPLHIAWGVGDPAWEGAGDLTAITLPSLMKWTSLTAEVGRRSPTILGFVEPDLDGEIVIPVAVGTDGNVQERRYRRAIPGPTKFLYMKANYEYSDAANVIIREAGVFMDTVVNPDLPPGQRYFTPAEVVSPGLLLAAQIISPSITRSPAIRQFIEFVIPI